MTLQNYSSLEWNDFFFLDMALQIRYRANVLDKTYSHIPTGTIVRRVLHRVQSKHTVQTDCPCSPLCCDDNQWSTFSKCSRTLCCCFCNSRVHGTVCSTNQKWNGIGGTVVIQYKTLQRHRSLTLWQLLRCVWWRTTQLGLCVKLPWLWAHDKAMALSRFGEASVKMIIHESGIRDPPSIPPCSEAIFIQRITKRYNITGTTQIHSSSI